MAVPGHPPAPGGAPRRSRWTSFVADGEAFGRVARGLHEEANPRHRVRVEHDRGTLLIHLSDEDGPGWTGIAVDRASRRTFTAWAPTQASAARAAHAGLHASAGDDAPPGRIEDPDSRGDTRAGTATHPRRS